MGIKTEFTTRPLRVITLTVLLALAGGIALTGCDTKDINIWHTGAVDGTVRDLNGTPVSDVEVWFPNMEAGARTDWEGNFYINQVPIGPSTLMAERKGYTTDAVSLLIEGNKTRENVFLTVIPLPEWSRDRVMTTMEFLETWGATLENR